MTEQGQLPIDSEFARTFRGELTRVAPLEALRWFRDEYISRHGHPPDLFRIVPYLRAAMPGISLNDTAFIAYWRGFGLGTVTDEHAEARLRQFLHLASAI